MRDDEKLEITAGEIRELAKKYETGSCNLYEVFPEVFDEEWGTVQEYRGIEIDTFPGFGSFVLRISHKGCLVARIYADGNIIMLQDGYRLRKVNNNSCFILEKRIYPCPK